MVVYAYNPSTQETDANLGCMKPCLKREKSICLTYTFQSKLAPSIQGQQDGSMGKVPAVKPKDQSSIPPIYMVDGEINSVSCLLISIRTPRHTCLLTQSKIK